ncbi:MAG: cytochrome b N-terminal domain-containing protein, partial [Burkholderiales bacterium]
MIRRVQHAGQWVFMRLEAAFNAFFGQDLNPLYHLGAIAYFFFWLALGSGIYIYIFFDTGVKDAYDSVEQLTRQWYLGGVMRSIHRYSSDGMVLAMLLHMVRHFTFDHYRNFRWFSWVTGVVLLWLVYASGINGYMLPWDRLAQFVTTATAEFLDSLPLFAGSLARNFSYREAVNDRLFSLLSFLHIGIPLGALIALWVHTQRVARAPTVPPRPIAIALTVSMLALAAAKPAVSQGPADLGTAVNTVGLDWFYLPAFPLIYNMAPMHLGALLAGITLLLFLVPWLPPRRARQTGEFHVTFRPSNMAS